MPTRIAMAKSAWIEQALPINYKLAVPASTDTGDVVVIVDLVVLVQTDRDSDGYSTCTLPCAHVQKITVYGRGDGVNSAVAVGDKLYVDAGDGQVNKDSTNGIVFGYALATVGSGANAAIYVGFGL